MSTEFRTGTGRRVPSARGDAGVSAGRPQASPAATQDERRAALAHEREYWERPLHKRWSHGPAARRRSGCTSRTATRWCGCAWRTSSVRTGLPPARKQPAPTQSGRSSRRGDLQCPPTCTAGYHRLHPNRRRNHGTAVVPPLGPPPGRASLATALQRRRNIPGGIGSLTDLTDLAVWSAARLAAPGSSGEPVARGRAEQAPWSPRRICPHLAALRQSIYLRIGPIPRYAFLRSGHRWARHARNNRQAHRKKRDQRGAVWKTKRAALSAGFTRVKRSAGRELAYTATPAGRDAASTISPPHGACWRRAHGPDWRTTGRHRCSTPGNAAVARFAAAPRRYRFPPLAAMAVDEQLTGAQAVRRASGMALGIMHDLAVGVSQRARLGVAGCWPSLSAPAPPDEFNQLGGTGASRRGG